MAAKAQKITLSVSRDIPFNKLVLSQSNVRRIKAGISIEELAEDIARRTLLTSLTVRPVLDEAGAETGRFEVPAGGRRYRALELLVKQKRLAKTAPVPCVVRTDGLPEEDSLAENVQRAPLHPLDQFRAFLAMREKGIAEEEIAATFFVSPAVVKQRLRLAAVSPRLLEVYAEDGMTLDQLMAFTVSPDHERQEQVCAALERSWSKEPHQIRRMLTEGAVRASDKRVRFVGIEAYVEADGSVLRDLFQPDDGGWLEDAGLLDRLVAEKLDREAEAILAEGWKWMEVAPDFPYGHTYGLRRLTGEVRPLSDKEAAAYEALTAEQEEIEAAHAEADELPDEVDQRLGEIEATMEAFENRPMIYEPDDIARAGAFVSIDGSGGLRVERGFVRPEDEAAVPEAEADGDAPVPDGRVEQEVGADGFGDADDRHVDPTAEEDSLRPLPDRLLTELTAHRTVALRDALANDPQIAFVAALHALVLRLFYRFGLDSCVEIEPKSAAFGAQAPGLADTDPAQAIEARHASWAQALPKEPGDLWEALLGFDGDSREALFGHCVSLTVNAVHEAWNRRPRALAYADRLAEALGLDMAKAGWQPTVESYLGRVTKAQILAAVREARGEAAAERIAHLKKAEMARAGEEVLAGTYWLPEPLRTPGQVFGSPEEPADIPVEEGEAQSAADGGETAMDDAEASVDPEAEPHPAHIAAE